MRVALVHDWLTGMRGGEKVLATLCGMFPEATLFTLLHVPGSCSPKIEQMKIVTSALDNVPGIGRCYRRLLPLMPWAIERLDASEFDLVISCSHCVAKGIRRRPGALHVCYCLTPMRYLWGQVEEYRRAMSWPSRLAMRTLSGRLKRWDRASAGNVDLFLSNSRYIAERIGQCYNRKAKVLYSPVDTDYFTPSMVARENFFLMVSALVPYKRVDQAVAAFGQLGLPLKIIGSGPELKRLRATAPANVEFLGWQSDESVREHYRRCQAVLFPQEEDFGLVPLEAMACGAPVIAYAAGGALETVLKEQTETGDGPTGVLYTPQTVDGLVAAVRRFQEIRERFAADRLVAWAGGFGHSSFVEGFRTAVEPLLETKGIAVPW